MLIQALIPSNRSPFKFTHHHSSHHHRLPFPALSQNVDFNVSCLNGFMNEEWGKRNNSKRVFSASGEQSSTPHLRRKRQVIEHLSLITAKDSISEDEEKDMLDFLYTTQYQMGGIIAISLGRVSDQNAKNYSHALYMRFQRKEDLAKFYENSFYLGVLREYVFPYCHGLTHVDYEAEVEDDMLPIFRKGEEYNYGVESVLLIAFVENALADQVEDAFASLERLTMENPSLIVQSTQGSNFNLVTSEEFTHVVMTRFRSDKAFEIFMNSSQYKEMWKSKFEPIIQKTVSLHFSVDPNGTDIM